MVAHIDSRRVSTSLLTLKVFDGPNRELPATSSDGCALEPTFGKDYEDDARVLGSFVARFPNGVAAAVALKTLVFVADNAGVLMAAVQESTLEGEQEIPELCSPVRGACRNGPTAG